MENFTNEKRRRYYGLRIGDRVKEIAHWPGVFREGVITAFNGMDNNSVFVKWDKEENPTSYVAEWLTISLKVEDAKQTT